MKKKLTKNQESLRAAYKLVLADMKRQTPCKDEDYCIGCYGCGLRLVYKTLRSHYEWMFNSREI